MYFLNLMDFKLAFMDPDVSEMKKIGKEISE